MIICVDSEMILLTPSGTMKAENIVAGDTLLSSQLTPVKVTCVSECGNDYAKERNGVVLCTEHTIHGGNVCKNMRFDPYILGFIMVNHLIVGDKLILHEDHPSIINYIDSQNLILDRNGPFEIGRAHV